jgi:hypothetical protein
MQAETRRAQSGSRSSSFEIPPVLPTPRAFAPPSSSLPRHRDKSNDQTYGDSAVTYACSGFYKSGDNQSIASNGKLDCLSCWGNDVERLAPDGTPCRGVASGGEWFDGTWFCGPRTRWW